MSNAVTECVNIHKMVFCVLVAGFKMKYFWVKFQLEMCFHCTDCMPKFSLRAIMEFLEYSKMKYHWCACQHGLLLPYQQAQGLK